MSDFHICMVTTVGILLAAFLGWVAFKLGQILWILRKKRN